MSPEEIRYEELATKAVDGLLNAEEDHELKNLLSTNPAWREELDDFLSIKKTTDAMRLRIAADARIEPPREAPGVKRGLGFGMVLIALGFLIIIAFAGYELAMADDVPMWLKAGYVLMGSGFGGLFLYVLRNRLRGLKHDPYSEIDR